LTALNVWYFRALSAFEKHVLRWGALTSRKMVLLLVVVVVTVMLHATTHAVDPLEYERAALVEFYHATKGPSWSISSNLWDVNNAASNYCGGNWYGITCVNANNGIQSIVLTKVGLSGTIPGSVGNWTQLERFVISFNAVSGSLPETLSRWTRMSDFDVNTNQLTGRLWPSFSAWNTTAGVKIDVSYNALSGTLPHELSKIDVVRFLALNNSFTGTLPPEYKSWTGITRFAPQNNFMTGSLPQDYASWTALESFDMEYNQFTGSLPPEYGPAWLRLRYFTVRDNLLNGSLPASYSNWTGLFEFMVNNNPITGTLPREYGETWHSIIQLFVCNTKISGTIPNEWGLMRSVVNAFLFGNNLTGTLPASFGNLSNLSTFSVALNSLSGTVPFDAWSSLRGVQAIVLQDNPLLSGTIPVSWNAIFATSFLPVVVSICRCNICGPKLSSLSLGYMCVPSDNVTLLSSVSSSTLSLISSVMTTSSTVSCSANSSPAPESFPTKTATRAHEPSANPTNAAPLLSSAAAVSKSSASVVVSVIAIQQLVPGVASAAGIRVMQSTLIIQRVRQLCTADSSSTGSSMNSESGDAMQGTILGSADAALCCDSSTSPTQLHIQLADPDDSPFTGAIVGNTVLVVGVALARVVGQLAVRHVLSSEAATAVQQHSAAQKFIFKPIRSVFDSCWGVALIWPMFCVLLAPTITVSIALIAMRKTSGVVFGIVLAVLWISPWVVATHGILYSGAPRPSPSVNFKRRPLPGEHRVLRIRRYLIEPKEELVLPRGGSRAFIRDFGPVFAPFRAARLWYFNVELTFSLINGILTGAALGVPPGESCAAISVIGWLLVAAGVLECSSALVVAPYSARIDFISLYVVNGLSLLAQVLALIDDSDTAQNASAVISLLATAFQLLLTVALTVDAVLASVLDVSSTSATDGGGSRLLRSITTRKEVQLWSFSRRKQGSAAPSTVKGINRYINGPYQTPRGASSSLLLHGERAVSAVPALQGAFNDGNLVTLIQTICDLQKRRRES
jgi:hypothetical protein